MLGFFRPLVGLVGSFSGSFLKVVNVFVWVLYFFLVTSRLVLIFFFLVIRIDIIIIFFEKRIEIIIIIYR